MLDRVFISSGDLIADRRAELARQYQAAGDVSAAAGGGVGAAGAGAGSWGFDLHALTRSDAASRNERPRGRDM